MRLLDYVEIKDETGIRYLELWYGDLTEINPKEAFDVLVISAFPDNYVPVRGTLIGSLYKKGISVHRLSKDKLVDIRTTCSCWLSKEIHSNQLGIQFKHILCFEPDMSGNPTDLVDGIFRSLIPFVIGDAGLKTIAMPLVSTGNVGAPVAPMMEALFTAAVKWLENGLPIECLKIVEYSPSKASEMKGAFSLLKQQYLRLISEINREHEYDIFISYSHKNDVESKNVITLLRAIDPNLNLFIDREDIFVGMSWQDKLFQSINGSKKVLALITPDYVNSRHCQDEFNFASLIHIKTKENTLYPLLIYDTELLPQMKRWQYFDCRIADKVKMRTACQQLVAKI